jgi:DNA-binding transcriptional LysR family regulator
MRLQISQPAVSRALTSLETNCARTLFTRDSGRLVPTSDGRAMAEDAKAVFQHLDRLSQGRTYESETYLRLVAPPTQAHRYLQSVIASFIEENRDIHVHLEIDTSTGLINAVAERRADLGLTDNPVDHHAIETIIFRRAQAHIVVPAGHPLEALDVAGPEDIVRYPFIAITRRFPSRTILETLVGERGLSLDIRVETSTAGSAAELVAEGAGIALLNPFPVALRKDVRLRFVPFKPVIPFATKFLMPRGVSNAAAQRFVDHLRNNATSDAYSKAL